MTTATISPGMVEPGSSTPYPSLPIASRSPDIASATRTPTAALLAITTPAGTGVARARFSTPASRWVTIATVRLTKLAEMIPRVMIPGT